MADMFSEARHWLFTAGEIAAIDPKVIELLATPNRVLIFRIPLKMDDGSRRIFDAYRVHYNDALGPCRDGTRIIPDLDLDEVKALGLLMCIKHAAGHIPAGGGKGGIAADPRELSEREFEQLCRAYIRQLRPMGPAYDVPGADIGTSAQTMAWMLDEYETINGYHCPAAVSDKPPVLGGSEGGEEATGRGVFETCEAAAKAMDLDLAKATVAIQGYGQVGSVAAAQLHAAGIRVVAVSDINGGIYRRQGLDIEALGKHLEKQGTVAEFPDTEAISNEQLLACECTILIPAAVQGVIHSGNADTVRARLVVEAANAPTSAKADAILAKKGVTIVPDVVANSGSVHVCQMERSQGLYDHYWDADTVNTLRRQRVLGCFEEARATAREYELSSARLGAWINALKYTEKVIHTRGWL